MSVPVIDLSTLLVSQDEDSNLTSRVKALAPLKQACEEWGFFQLLNPGIDPELVQQLLTCSQQFFALPESEKLKLVTPLSPIGFRNRSGARGVTDRREHLLFFAPSNSSMSHLNAWPAGHDADNFRCVVERMMDEGSRVSKLLAGIVLESLGLSVERCRKLLNLDVADKMALPFYPASPPELEQEVVLGQHQDGVILTLLFQINGVPGLQILKDGEWIAVAPAPMVVILGDVMQVWSNTRFKSVVHRVAKHERDRFSCAYFHSPGNETWIAPLEEFTVEEPPKYRAFLLGEYQRLKMKYRNVDNKDKEVTIEHHAINS